MEILARSTETVKAAGFNLCLAYQVFAAAPAYADSLRQAGFREEFGTFTRHEKDGRLEVYMDREAVWHAARYAGGVAAVAVGESPIGPWSAILMMRRTR